MAAPWKGGACTAATHAGLTSAGTSTTRSDRMCYTPKIVKWQILSVTLSHRERVWTSSTKMAVNGSWPRGRSEAQLDRGTSAGSLLGTVGQPALRLRSGELSTTCESYPP